MGDGPLEIYSDVVMIAMTSQITGFSIVYLTVCSGAEKTPKLCVTDLYAGISPVPGEFPAQKASNAEDISIWWRHNEVGPCRFTTNPHDTDCSQTKTLSTTHTFVNNHALFRILLVIKKWPRSSQRKYIGLLGWIHKGNTRNGMS